MRNNSFADRVFLRKENDPKSAFIKNFFRSPMTITAAAANLIAGGCITLSNGIIMSLMLLVILPSVGAMATIKSDRFSKKSRPAVYFLFCAAVMLAVSLMCNGAVPGSADGLGIFMPLTALDTVVFLRLMQTASTDTAAEGAAAGAGTACAFAAMALPLSFIRGLLGGGWLFGEYVFDGINALQMPFFGFILCGFAVVIFKRISAGFFGVKDCEDMQDDQ